MNDCTSMRELMLEAELAELEGEGTSALARHVRRCASCRKVARSLAADTDALALLVATTPRPAPLAPERIRGGVLQLNRGWRGPRARDVALALPLAAAIVLAVVWRPGRENVSGPTASPLVGGAGAPAATAVSAAPGSPAASPAEAVGRQPAGNAGAPELTPRVASTPARASAAPAGGPGVGGEAFLTASPISFAPVAVRVAVTATVSTAMQSPPLPHDVDAIRVTPERGSRALVMGTRDPAVTVVWLY